MKTANNEKALSVLSFSQSALAEAELHRDRKKAKLIDIETRIRSARKNAKRMRVIAATTKKKADIRTAVLARESLAKHAESFEKLQLSLKEAEFAIAKAKAAESVVKMQDYWEKRLDAFETRLAKKSEQDFEHALELFQQRWLKERQRENAKRLKQEAKKGAQKIAEARKKAITKIKRAENKMFTTRFVSVT